MVPLVKGLWLSPPNRSQPAAVGSAAGSPAPRLAHGFLNSCLPTHTVTVTVSPDTHPQPATTATQGFSFSGPREWGATPQPAATYFSSLQCVWGTLPSSLRAASSPRQVPHFVHTPTYVHPPPGHTSAASDTLPRTPLLQRDTHAGVSTRRHPDKGLPE